MYILMLKKKTTVILNIHYVLNCCNFPAFSIYFFMHIIVKASPFDENKFKNKKQRIKNINI